MSKLFNCVVDTHSKKDREQLINFLAKNYKIFSIIDDIDGFNLVGIREDGYVGYLGAICAKDLVSNHRWMHFSSVDEYIIYQREHSSREQVFSRVGFKKVSKTHKTGYSIFFK